MGSGSASKTRLLIEALLRSQPDLLLCGGHFCFSARKQFTDPAAILSATKDRRLRRRIFQRLKALSQVTRGRTLALFLGSNISNFEPADARLFLDAMRGMLRPGDALLLGADLKKDRQVLEGRVQRRAWGHGRLQPQHSGAHQSRTGRPF